MPLNSSVSPKRLGLVELPQNSVELPSVGRTASGRPKDFQVSKVYEAENRLFDYVRDKKFRYPFDTGPYVDKILKSSFIKQNYGDVWGEYITMRPQKKRVKNAQYWGYEIHGEIYLPVTEDRWALRELVILHEVAHHLGKHQFKDQASHGPEFAKRFLDLVGEFVKVNEAAERLRISFQDKGVKVAD
jgi:putative metallohydrolase (TIGR04338 family)